MEVVKKNRSWFYFSLGVISLLILSTLLWVLPAGAAPAGATAGAITTTPTEVSPDNAISSGSRDITISLADADLNTSQFVGVGPNGEVADIGTADGERLSLSATQGVGTFIRSLTLNPVGTAGSTPLADRDGDGDVDINDVVISSGDLDNDGTVDIAVSSLFNASRGQVAFNLFLDLSLPANAAAARGFNVAYATSSRELTRATKSFTETLNSPGSSIITGESFTIALGNVAAAGNVITIVSNNALSEDLVTASGVTKATFTSIGDMTTGDTITVAYTGDDTLSPSVTLLIATQTADANTFTSVLSITLLDTNDDGGITAADITVTSGLVGGAAITVTAYAQGTRTATFAFTGGLTTTDTFKVRYLGSEALAVPTNTAIQNGETFTLDLTLENLPLQDTNGDSVISSGDITVKIGTRTKKNLPLITSIGVIDSSGVASGIASGSRITLVHSGSEVTVGTDIKVTYLGLEDLVTVKGSRDDAVKLRLRETGPDTGVYEATIIAIDGALNEPNVLINNLDPSGNPVNVATGGTRIAVINGGSITVKYNDRNPLRTESARIRVESDGPSFSNIGPANKSSTNDVNTLLTAEVTDSIAGVDPTTGTSVNIIFTTDLDAVSGDNIVGRATDTVPNSSVIETGGGKSSIISETFAGSGVFKVSYSIGNVPEVVSALAAATEIVNLAIAWQIEVKDKAGNAALTDVRTVTVDNTKPVFQDSFTGDFWDAKNARLASSRAGQAGGDSRTSIRVEFDGTMDGSTFQTSDFLVGGVAPIAVAHFVGSADSVFLTVSELTPDATPTVQIVGSVSDDGGNVLTTGSKAAVDGISPKLTVTFANGVNYSKGAISLRVVSDEKIAGSLPRRIINTCATARACTSQVSPNTVSRIVSEQLEWTFDLTVTTLGLHNLRIEAEDTPGNTTSAGTTSDPNATGALSFEIDTAIPAPTSTTPADDASQSAADPFVYEIDWTAEGTEYAGTTGDTHQTVTLTKVVLDAGTAGERDVLALHSTRNNRTFSIAITNPAIGLGAHTMTFNGTDELGNTLATDVVNDFTVVAPPKFTINLNPGLNLVSIPRDPEDGSVKTIFGDLTQVKLIFTRPRVSDGEPDVQWLQAERDPLTGNFESTGTPIDLTTIDSRHAYWVESTASVTVEIILPSLAATSIPPILPVVGGIFNLVPVMSLAPLEPTTATASTADISEGTEFDADTYFGGNWTSAFTFSLGQWVGITPDRDRDGVGTTLHDSVQVGRGYWVLFTKDDILTPAVP